MKRKISLQFALKVLSRMRLNVYEYRPGASLPAFGPGFMDFCGFPESREHAAESLYRLIQDRTVYKLSDRYALNYLCLRLPEEESILLIGPYLSGDFSNASLENLLLRLGISPSKFAQFKEAYAKVPVFPDQGAIMSVVCTLAETLWQDEGGFEITEFSFHSPLPAEKESVEEAEATFDSMQQMEERYAFENELMEIVSHGLTHRAELIMENISILSFEMRSVDPLRNMKNYCIICNTLLRKAAQQGGVHPLHIDRHSGKYARIIEKCETPAACRNLIGDMIRSYCRLVRSHTISRFSQVVQKAVTYIEENLSGDLSLKALAEMQNVTPAYLSMIFHKETGRTLTEHIMDQRMEIALQLLKDRHLQIQAVAQKCGISDSNYFTKLFKRAYGVTPRRFREMQAPPSAPE